jgi:hypothetical protein
MSLEIPEYWRQFRDSSNLLNREVEIPDTEDLSGVGADIEFFADDSIICEMNDAYPGIVVQKDGFLPVGGCQVGTGDPYFIQVSEGAGGSLYQIYHDAVREDGYSREAAVALVLKDYRDILKFASPS